jgi:hypothetical protein
MNGRRRADPWSRSVTGRSYRASRLAKPLRERLDQGERCARHWRGVPGCAATLPQQAASPNAQPRV